MKTHSSRALIIGLAMAVLLTGKIDLAHAQPTVRLQDKTSSTGLTLESGPIASAAFEGSGDGRTDLQLHYGSATADIFESSSPSGGVPFWYEDTTAYYDTTPPPSGSHSPLTLDFNNDGHIDLLVRYYPKLYEGDGS